MSDPGERQLLDDARLFWSDVVANRTMNRERSAVGRANSYEQDLRLNVLDFLTDRLGSRGRASWLDLCCGTGKALIEAGRHFHAAGLAERVELLGVDLVGMFFPVPLDVTCVKLVEASLADWTPPPSGFDLVTCVHGLHYVGDKLGVIARATSWLAADGLFVANIDLANLRLADGSPAGRPVAAALRAGGVDYDRRHRLIRCTGRRSLRLPLRYLGADDRAGPNYTRQPAVNSHYELAPPVT